MATGKLSNTEKFAIKGMLTDGKTVEEIAVELGRTALTVSKYASEELDSIINTIVATRLKAEETASDEEPAFKAEINKETRIQTMHKLKGAGLDKTEAKEIIERVLRKLDFHPDNGTQLYALCIRSLNAKDLMVTRAAGGRGGVAAMTQAASERIDESKKRSSNKPSRKIRDHVWKPKEGEMM